MHQLWCVPSADLHGEIQAFRKDFGARLRSARQLAGLTQEGLAELAGVDRKLIYRTELAQTSPRLDAVVQIALALNVSVHQLLGG